MPLLEQGHWSAPGTTPALVSTPLLAHRSLEAASGAQIYQKLQNFYRGTQVECGQGLVRMLLYTLSWLMAYAPPCQAELERERAQLLVRATKAEEQLSELQEYVDQHLGRYALGKVGRGWAPNTRGRVCSQPGR